jgi:hypothetical protein
VFSGAISASTRKHRLSPVFLSPSDNINICTRNAAATLAALAVHSIKRNTTYPAFYSIKFKFQAQSEA